MSDPPPPRNPAARRVAQADISSALRQFLADREANNVGWGGDARRVSNSAGGHESAAGAEPALPAPAPSYAVSSGAGPVARDASTSASAETLALVREGLARHHMEAAAAAGRVANARAGYEAARDADRVGAGAGAADSDAAAAPPLFGAANAQARNGLGFDLQVAARWVEQTVPVAVILLMVFVYKHARAILTFAWMSAVLFRANDFLRAQVALRSERKTRDLVYLLVIVVTQISITYVLFPSDPFWSRLVLIPRSQTPSFLDAIWEVALADTIVRYVGICVKVATLAASGRVENGAGERGRIAGVGEDGGGGMSGGAGEAGGGGDGGGSAAASRMSAALPGPIPIGGGRSLRRRIASRLSLVEYVSLLYRALLPVPVWFAFFQNEEEYGHLFSSITTGLYLTFKIRAAFDLIRHVYGATQAMLSMQAQYGQVASVEDVMEGGDCCAICQEKYCQPIKLRCKHVFCEECVSEWFERERTCPLCRAVIKPAGLKSYGDGGTVMSTQIF